MSKSDQHSKVSLEDLLRLKRAERPSPEFWSKFESELRQKQLTALVQKRRWWHELPVSISRRFYLPAGAAAVAALTLVTIRYSVPTPLAQVATPIEQAAAADSVIEVLAATEVAGSALVQPSQYDAIVTTTAEPVPVMALPGDATEAVAAISQFRDVETSPARALVANLNRFEQVESDLTDSLISSRLTDSARAQQDSAGQSEVAAMTSASTTKYRLIARYADRALSPAPAAPAVVRERLARRLGDDLNDDISRVGVVGSRVSLKF